MWQLGAARDFDVSLFRLCLRAALWKVGLAGRERQRKTIPGSRILRVVASFIVSYESLSTDKQPRSRFEQNVDWTCASGAHCAELAGSHHALWLLLAEARSDRPVREHRCR